MNPSCRKLVCEPLILLPLLFIFASGVQAQSSIGRETLRDLQGIGIVIDVTNPEVERHDLRAADLRSSVEAQLSKAGIKVLPIPKMLEARGKPHLYITINAEKTASELYAYSVSVRFKQEIMLPRVVSGRGTTMAIFTGTTWEQNDAVGLIEAGKFPSVNGTVGTLVERFIGDYLAVNKK